MYDDIHVVRIFVVIVVDTLAAAAAALCVPDEDGTLITRTNKQPDTYVMGTTVRTIRNGEMPFIRVQRRGSI